MEKAIDHIVPSLGDCISRRSAGYTQGHFEDALTRVTSCIDQEGP